MSTHAAIIKKYGNGFLSSYIHHDGYIESVGVELVRSFSEPALAEWLFSHGGWSTIGNTSRTDSPLPNYPAKPLPDQEHRFEKTLADASADWEFSYLWDDGQWWLVIPGGYVTPLAPIVAQVRS